MRELDKSYIRPARTPLVPHVHSPFPHLNLPKETVLSDAGSASPRTLQGPRLANLPCGRYGEILPCRR